MKRLYRLLAVLLACVLIAAILPRARAVSALDHDPHDVEKLAAFFGTTSPSGALNGVSINGSGFDIEDPSTWTQCTWDSSGRLSTLVFDNLGFAVGGELDLSGCTGLTLLQARDCQITRVDVSDCTALAALYVTGNRITELDHSNTPALTALWFDHNSITQADLSGNPLLTSFDCSYNPITELDVTCCPGLTVLRCCNTGVSVLDVTNCTELTELNCKSTLIEELDISGLSHLQLFYCFNTRIRHLDVSAFNGGESFTIDAVGLGSIGFRTYLGSSTVYKASSLPLDGGIFRGWYLDGELVSEDADFTLPFGSGPRELKAYFYEMGDVDHSLRIDSADALLVLRLALGIIDESSIDTVLADYNGDGVINTVDALLILRKALGIA